MQRPCTPLRNLSLYLVQVRPSLLGKFVCGFFTLLIAFIALHTNTNSLLAQKFPPVTDPTGRFGMPPPFMQEEVRPSEPLPEVVPEGPQVEPEKKEILPLRLFVREIHVVGSTVFTPEELAQVVAPYVNREVSTEELEEIRQALTQMYIDKGYITSGAFIPDQSVSEGIIVFQTVEGKLTDISVEGTDWFRPYYFTSRLQLSAGPPVNIINLRNRLGVFLQDQRIERINADLQPGLKPGESSLKVTVAESNPWIAILDFNNFQSPTVGAERILATAGHSNPLGLGDAFSFTYGRSEGVNPLIDTSYAIPFTPWDTTLIFQYRQNDFKVVESPFDPLNITSNTDIYTLSIRQPVYRTPDQELALYLIGEYLQNRGFLLGIPFGFIPGATAQGKVNISALRFAQEWVYRRPNQVFSARSRFSLGLDVFDATITGSEAVPDGQFFVWLGQFQAARRFDLLGVQLIGRMEFQFTPDSLFALEQFAMGGRYTVRGYRQNSLIRDNAFLFSVETRIPVLPQTLGAQTVQFAPFIDVGRSWNTGEADITETIDTDTLASIGVGLLLAFPQTSFPMFQNTYANVYWGLELNHIPDPNQNLQDHGVFIQVLTEVF